MQYSYTDDKLTGITRGGVNYSFEYDGFGNNVKTKVGDAVLAQNSYDNATGLLTGTVYGNGGSVSFGYDEYGRVVSSSTGGVLRFSYTYDKAGRMVKSYDHLNSCAYNFKYDMRGRLCAKQCTDGTSIRYIYDSRDYLTNKAVSVGGWKYGIAYSYGSGSSAKPYKNRVYGMTFTDVNATAILFNTSNTYDSLDRLSSHTLNILMGGISQTTQYTYHNGTALPHTVTVGGKTYTYFYDAAGNISRVGDGSSIIEYEYDALGQLVREDNGATGKTVTYVYDNSGNILSRTEYAYSPMAEDLSALTPTATASYTYGNDTWKDQLTAYNGQSITYDAIGNPLSYRGMSMTWQNGRELAALTKTGVNASYAYGEGGLRISKTVNGTETQYCWDGSRLMAQKTGDTWMHFLYDETGSVIGFRYNGGIYIFTKNLQGDIISVVNAFSGETAASYVYDSWGRVISSSGTLADINPIRYRGYYYDTETGLYYLQSR